MSLSNVNSTVNLKLLNQSKIIKVHLEKGFEIYNQLSLKNYAGAVNSTISLVEDLLYPNGSSLKLSNDMITNIINTNQYSLVTNDFKSKFVDSASISASTVSFKQNELAAAFLFNKDRHAINIIRNLSGFLNNVMLSGDAKQLSKVVESYAMPVGSYKRKRNSWL
jgi:hypothetical protein